MSTWLNVADDHPYGIDNLPYASAMGANGTRRVVVRIGDVVLDLTRAAMLEDFDALFADGTLDPLLAAGPAVWADVRERITEWLTDDVHRERLQPLLRDVADVELLLPFRVADYVDFYASEHHATNVGRMFRPDGEPLTPNWRHLPIGYHGRSGTIVVSGTEVRRPHGQFRGPDGALTFGASARMDFEAELGFVVGVPSARGEPVAIDRFGEHVFGVCLVNDWSARDIQAWEYVPLGPFLGKSFATSVSAWVTPLAALSAAWIPPPRRSEPLLPYLDDAGRADGLDIRVEIRLNGEVVSRPPFSAMYWTPAQMLAHLTVNGASVRTGDLYASGTISGPEPDQRGCLLELTWNGAEPIPVGGQQRGFLADGDEVTISASAAGPSGPIGLGEVRGRLVG